MKLGILGLSEGNGHPYSWSAIFNGYDRELMESCGFPTIPRYLELQKWPESRICGAEVVTVWTQSEDLSRKIAASTKISKVVFDYEEMIGQVDAVLLARDDSERHLDFASPFLREGLPVYIDKPIALSKAKIEEIYSFQQYEGQIFTCSSLRYSADVNLTDVALKELGPISRLTGRCPKSWAKYGIHIVEPLLRLIADDDIIVKAKRFDPVSSLRGTGLYISWASGVEMELVATGRPNTPISFCVEGKHGIADLVFRDTFFSFRSALSDFIAGIKTGTIRSDRTFNERAVGILERGM